VNLANGSWELRLGDCLDATTGMASLGDKSVDHVITDPPYSKDLYLKFRTNAGTRDFDDAKAKREMKNDAIGSIDDILPAVTANAIRLARRWMLAFHDVESGHRWREHFGETYVRAGVWVKPNAVPQISGDRPGQGFESLTIAHQPGRKRWNGGGHPAVWTFMAVNSQDDLREAAGHPCPKPIALMEKLVRDFTDPGDLILDPFAGSGTTGVAAIRLGRRFIGWEKDPKYHAIAVKRLTAAREQLELCA